MKRPKQTSAIEQTNNPEILKKSTISRRQVLKNSIWIPFIGGTILSSFKSQAAESISGGVSELSFAGLPSKKPDNWYKFCRPILEWINPHQNIDCEAYVGNLIKVAKAANANTVYFVIDYGGSPLYNGSSEKKASIIRDFDLIAYLEKRLHEEKLYFVAAQFGGHTIGAMAIAHPDWAQRDIKGEFVYGPGAIPMMCFNTGYADYVANELQHIVRNYKTDGVYIEGLYYTIKKCYCESCKAKYMKEYHTAIPENPHVCDLPLARFYMDSIVSFIDKANRKIKAVSPQTIVMACPASNDSGNGNTLTRIDWQKLGQAADVVTLERMWGYGMNYPLWKIGMNANVMLAESKKLCFTTAWYARNVDREYTPRSRASLLLNYYEPFINGATPQHHTQNALEEAPDQIPTLHELHSYTEKIRPYFFYSERIGSVSLLYDRDNYWPDDHFSGYYKSLVYNHIPFRVISRDELNQEGLKNSTALILPNILKLSDAETNAIKNFTAEGGILVATYKTGFQTEDAKTSTIAGFLGVNKFNGEIIAGINPSKEPYSQNRPENYCIKQCHYFRNEKGSVADDAAGLSLMAYAGGLLEVQPALNAKVISNTYDFDLSRQGPQHPVYGFYPGKIHSPLIIESSFQKGKVIYFAGALDKSFLLQGYHFLSGIMTSAILSSKLPVTAEAPSTIEMTFFENKDDNTMLINLLNTTTNDRLTPDPASEIIPVGNIKIKVRGFKNAVSLGGSPIETSMQGETLTIRVQELKVIETLIIS